MLTWRPYIEKTAAKNLGTYIRTYSIFKSKHLSANIKLIVYRALIRSTMTYTCPTWEFEADTYFTKLQRLQNRILRAIGNTDMSTTVHDLHLRVQNSVRVRLHKQIMEGTGKSFPKSRKSKCYVQFDKEKPGTGSIKS
jgi:predicted lipase